MSIKFEVNRDPDEWGDSSMVQYYKTLYSDNVDYWAIDRRDYYTITEHIQEPIECEDTNLTEVSLSEFESILGI